MQTEFYSEHLAISEFEKGKSSVFAFTNTVANNGENPSTVIIETKEKTSGVIASWGSSNDLPQKIIEAVRKNGTASRALSLNVKAHYGNGVILQSKSQADDNGKKSPSLRNIEEFPDIDAFFTMNQVQRFTLETVTDLEWWGMAFPEYILSNNFASINRIRRHRAAWCRYEVMNDSSGMVENAYISQKFGLGSVNLDSNFVAKVPLIDSYWSADEVREYCKSNGIYKFIRPIFYPLLDESYYPTASWHSIINSGWLDIANDIPEFKRAIFNNQISIKYQIEIDERYFENVYGKSEWLGMDPTKRKGIRKSVIDIINDSLSGNSKAGKSIQSMMFLDDNGQQVSAIKITAIDDKYQNGVYLPEASAANSEIAVATGVDASLIGGSGIPGGTLGAGSGSDKRVAFDILSTLMRANRMTSINPIEFIQQYNGWDPSIKFGIESTSLTTLDANPTGQKQVAT